MTTAEEKALNEAKQILNLHFDAFVLTTRTRDEDDTDRVNSDWHGSLSDILGLSRITQLRIEHVAIARSDLP